MRYYRQKVAARYRVATAQSYTFRRVTGSQLKQLAEETKLFNPKGSYLMEGGYDWRDALAMVAYDQHKPVAWVLLDKDPEAKTEHDALLMRYTDPAHRGRGLSVRLAGKLIPEFRRQHPELTNLILTKPSEGVELLWRQLTSLVNHSQE